MRMTKVLHLDYYYMTHQELEERMRAKSCQDATPQLDFENKDKRLQNDLAGDDDTILKNIEGLRQIGYAPAGSAAGKGQVESTSTGETYWHADDPAFSHTLGQSGKNKYTRKLLEQVGFMQLSDVYWVWQGSDGAMQKGAAPAAVDRLDEMCQLLKSCQTTMHRQGNAFTGHFSLRR